MGYPNLVGRGKANKWAAAQWNEKVLPISVRGLEWVAPKGTSISPTPVALNEYYSKGLLADVPSIVSRAVALRPLETTATIPRQVNVYLEQSTRSFVAGLWDGAVALARACLEETLEDRVGRYIGRQDRELARFIREGADFGFSAVLILA